MTSLIKKKKKYPFLNANFFNPKYYNSKIYIYIFFVRINKKLIIF